MSTAPFQPMPGSLPGAAAQYDLAYQICPIILQNGIVSNAPGKIAPITAYLPPTGDDGEPFATFVVMPGGKLISQSIGEYPMANQAVAANATIKLPLEVSLLMVAPVNQPGGYQSKRSAFTNLQQTLAMHNAQGGTYFVATPSFLYDYTVLLNMSDVSDEESKQKQILWQLDFRQPIVTLASITQPFNGLYSSITAGQQLPTPPTNSGLPSANTATLTGVVAALAAFGGPLAPQNGTSGQ